MAKNDNETKKKEVAVGGDSTKALKQPKEHHMQPMKYKPVPHFKGGCGHC